MPSIWPYGQPVGMGLTVALGGGSLLSGKWCSVAYDYPGPVLQSSVLGPSSAAESFGMIYFV